MTEANKPSPDRPPRLHSLGGNAATPAIREGWSLFLQWPEQAQRETWTLLVPFLAHPESPDNDLRFRGFCQKHQLEPRTAARSIESLNALLRHACAQDVDAKSFEEDLAALSGVAADGVGVILAGYEKAREEIRRDIVRRTLADHGKLLVGVDWRVDRITASDRGLDLEAPILILTLRYQEGVREERITFQLQGDAVRQLQRVCDRFET